MAGSGEKAGFCFIFGREARSMCEIGTDSNVTYYHRGVTNWSEIIRASTLHTFHDGDCYQMTGDPKGLA